EQPHFCVENIVPAHCQLQRMQYTCGEITGRGQHFRHADVSAGFFDNGNVSEGAANIDAEPPNHAPCSPLRRSYCRLTAITLMKSRRRIAFPEAQTVRLRFAITARICAWWNGVPRVGSPGNNSGPLMSALGQKQTFPHA